MNAARLQNEIFAYMHIIALLASAHFDFVFVCLLCNKSK